MEVNESMTFKNFYFNIEEKLVAEANGQTNNNDSKIRRKDSKKSLKVRFSSKGSSISRKASEDPIVIHNVRGYSKRKSARFKGIVPDSGNKIVNVIRNDSKSGIVKIDLIENED